MTQRSESELRRLRATPRRIESQNFDLKSLPEDSNLSYPRISWSSPRKSFHHQELEQGLDEYEKAIRTAEATIERAKVKKEKIWEQLLPLSQTHDERRASSQLLGEAAQYIQPETIDLTGSDEQESFQNKLEFHFRIREVQEGTAVPSAAEHSSEENVGRPYRDARKTTSLASIESDDPEHTTEVIPSQQPESQPKAPSPIRPGPRVFRHEHAAKRKRALEALPAILPGMDTMAFLLEKQRMSEIGESSPKRTRISDDLEHEQSSPSVGRSKASRKRASSAPSFSPNPEDKDSPPSLPPRGTPASSSPMLRVPFPDIANGNVDHESPCRRGSPFEFFTKAIVNRCLSRAPESPVLSQPTKIASKKNKFPGKPAATTAQGSTEEASVSAETEIQVLVTSYLPSSPPRQLRRPITSAWTTVNVPDQAAISPVHRANTSARQPAINASDPVEPSSISALRTVTASVAGSKAKAKSKPVKVKPSLPYSELVRTKVVKSRKVKAPIESKAITQMRRREMSPPFTSSHAFSNPMPIEDINMNIPAITAAVAVVTDAVVTDAVINQAMTDDAGLTPSVQQVSTMQPPETIAPVLRSKNGLCEGACDVCLGNRQVCLQRQATEGPEACQPPKAEPPVPTPKATLPVQPTQQEPVQESQVQYVQQAEQTQQDVPAQQVLSTQPAQTDEQTPETKLPRTRFVYTGARARSERARLFEMFYDACRGIEYLPIAEDELPDYQDIMEEFNMAVYVGRGNSREMDRAQRAAARENIIDLVSPKKEPVDDTMYGR